MEYTYSLKWTCRWWCVFVHHFKSTHKMQLKNVYFGFHSRRSIFVQAYDFLNELSIHNLRKINILRLDYFIWLYVQFYSLNTFISDVRFTMNMMCVCLIHLAQNLFKLFLPFHWECYVNEYIYILLNIRAHSYHY